MACVAILAGFTRRERSMFSTQPITRGFMVTKKIFMLYTKSKQAPPNRTRPLLYLHLAGQLFKVSLYSYDKATKNSGGESNSTADAVSRHFGPSP